MKQRWDNDAHGVLMEIRAFLKASMADHDTSIDSGGGDNFADCYPTIGGVQYVITVKKLGRGDLPGERGHPTK